MRDRTAEVARRHGHHATDEQHDAERQPPLEPGRDRRDQADDTEGDAEQLGWKTSSPV